MRRGCKFPSDLRSPFTFTPVLHRPHTVLTILQNYMKGGLIGIYVHLSFQKPFRESPSSGTSHSRSRGKLHDRNRKTAATKIPRSAGDAAHICARYHLLSSRDGAECHHDLQKRLTRRRQQQADDAHSSLIKLRGSGLSASHFTLSHYTELFSEAENDALPPSKAASSGVTSAPFSHCTTPWRSSSSPTSSSSCPIPQSTSSPPDTWLPIPNHNFQTRKKTPPCGRVFSFSGC